MAARSSVSSKPCRKKGQSTTSVTGRRTRQRDKPQVLSSHHRLCGVNRRGGRWEWRRGRGAERERHLPSGRARDHMVVEDAVTSMRHRCTTARSSNFCRSRSRRSASMNGGKMRQRDNAGVLCKERNTALLEKTNGSWSGFVTTLQGDFTLRHPQPAMNPTHRSLASSVVSSCAKTASVHLHPSHPSVAADEQSTKGRECAPLEIHV